jgi:hypothetical protein
VGGTVIQPSPTPIEITRPFLTEAYTEISLVAGHIEQLSGRPAERILHPLHDHGYRSGRPGAHKMLESDVHGMTGFLGARHGPTVTLHDVPLGLSRNSMLAKTKAISSRS